MRWSPFAFAMILALPAFARPSADDDGDGVPNAVEDRNGNGLLKDDDSDGDGVPDHLDVDDDGDGLLTIDEDVGSGGTANWDAFDPSCTADAIPNYLDIDSDGDGVCDGRHHTVAGVCFEWNTPGDLGTGQGADRDPTAAEVFWIETLDEDIDWDGLPNAFDCNDQPEIEWDWDGLSTPDELAICMPPSAGVCPDGAWELCSGGEDKGTCTSTITACCCNPQDPDTDDDCVLDGIEAPGAVARDTDADGTPDVMDRDDDGDGVATALEYYAHDDWSGEILVVDGQVVRIDAASCQPAWDPYSFIGPEDMDTDDDGLPDYRDPDDDGDGLDTLDEDADGDGDPTDDDSDHDGLPDYLDAADDGPCGDFDGDGVNNGIEDALGISAHDVDSDNDGIPDPDELWADGPCAAPHPDPHAFDPAACLAVDSTFDFACPTLACCAGSTTVSDPGDDDDDDDDIPTAVEGTFDQDGDGIPNYLDTDSDGDGIDDADEGTGDDDGDGIPNFLDDEYTERDTGNEPYDLRQPPRRGCLNQGGVPGAWWLLALVALRRRHS